MMGLKVQLKPQPAPFDDPPARRKGEKIPYRHPSNMPLSCSNQKGGCLKPFGTRRPNQSFHAASAVLI